MSYFFKLQTKKCYCNKSTKSANLVIKLIKGVSGWPPESVQATTHKPSTHVSCGLLIYLPQDTIYYKSKFFNFSFLHFNIPLDINFIQMPFGHHKRHLWCCYCKLFRKKKAIQKNSFFFTKKIRLQVLLTHFTMEHLALIF